MTLRVALVRPTGVKGGGMMCVADYLRDSSQWLGDRPSFTEIDIRGTGPLLSTLAQFRRQSARLEVLARQGEVDLVHLFVGDRLSLLRKCAFARVCKRLELPVLLHVHASRFNTFVARLPMPMKHWIRDTFTQAQQIVVLGPLTARFLIDQFGVDPAAIQIIPNGVAAPELAARAVRAAGASQALFLGNLSRDKGVDDLLHAMTQPCTAATKLLLAGGGDLPYYRRLADKLGVKERVEFLGWRDRREVQELLSNVDVLALPSHAEAMPLSVLEAFGYALPVVTTRRNELSHIDGIDGAIRYVTPGDYLGLARALSDVVSSPEMAQAMGQAGRRVYDTHFKLSRFVESIEQVYSRVARRAVTLPQPGAAARVRT